MAMEDLTAICDDVRFATVPVHIYSTSASSCDQQISAGANDFFIKPERFEDV
jgi:hypothetical protein